MGPHEVQDEEEEEEFDEDFDDEDDDGHFLTLFFSALFILS